MRDYRHFLFFAEYVGPDRLTLDAAETHHCVTVLRLAQGDPFVATDGMGTIYECTFNEVIKNELNGHIISRTLLPRLSGSLHMMVGLPERAPFEALLADLTALGVARITPLVCKYCQQPWWAGHWEKLAARFRSKMVASLKQARYPYLPQLDAPISFQKALATSAMSGFCVVADPHGVPISGAFEVLRCRQEAIVGIVGPPGGLAPEETAALKALGVIAVSLVPTRLTTELAAVVLCSQILGSALVAQQGKGGAPTSSPGAAA